MSSSLLSRVAVVYVLSTSRNGESKKSTCKKIFRKRSFAKWIQANHAATRCCRALESPLGDSQHLCGNVLFINVMSLTACLLVCGLSHASRCWPGLHLPATFRGSLWGNPRKHCIRLHGIGQFSLPFHRKDPIS